MESKTNFNSQSKTIENPEKSRSSEAPEFPIKSSDMERIKQIVKTPHSKEKEEEVFKILKSNDFLYSAFLNRKKQVEEQKSTLKYKSGA